MKSLSSYLKTHTKFTVAGTTSDKLLIFDVDDTLIHTSAKIWVMKGGKRIKTLTNSEYNDYKLEQGKSSTTESSTIRRYSTRRPLLNTGVPSNTNIVMVLISVFLLHATTRIWFADSSYEMALISKPSWYLL